MKVGKEAVRGEGHLSIELHLFKGAQAISSSCTCTTPASFGAVAGWARFLTLKYAVSSGSMDGGTGVQFNMIDLLICNHDVDYEGTKAKGYASQNSERHGEKKK